jgi:catechol 2,3-dioxygenase-like lactoylglutathione lyase family enzyme
MRPGKGEKMMEMTHTRLLVTDFKECFMFYRDVMGFPVLWGNENGTYADFDAGGHKLALFGRAPMADAICAAHPEPRLEQQDHVCLVFAAGDVDTAYETLLHKGVVPINEPHDRKDWGIRCFHFRDPDGNLIEVNVDFGVEGE